MCAPVEVDANSVGPSYLFFEPLFEPPFDPPLEPPLEPPPPPPLFEPPFLLPPDFEPPFLVAMSSMLLFLEVGLGCFSTTRCCVAFFLVA